ncbi:hypothetical protein Abr02nite_27430 [Paractinoplanes brasiliensis]|nr:hypothetical protein Abr02nite_27430 [Actinoplanes brasiliensis]
MTQTVLELLDEELPAGLRPYEAGAFEHPDEHRSDPVPGLVTAGLLSLHLLTGRCMADRCMADGYRGLRSHQATLCPSRTGSWRTLDPKRVGTREDRVLARLHGVNHPVKKRRTPRNVHGEKPCGTPVLRAS